MSYPHAWSDRTQLRRQSRCHAPTAQRCCRRMSGYSALTPPHSLRVLLHRPKQGPPGSSIPVASTASPHWPRSTSSRIALALGSPDHLPSPERKLEAELQRTLARDRTIEPPHLGGADAMRPTLQSSGFQCTPTLAPVPGQPGVNAASRKAQRLDHRFWALARLNSLHRTNPNLFQRLMVEGTEHRVASCRSFHSMSTYL